MFFGKKYKKGQRSGNRIGSLPENIEKCKKTIHIAAEKYIIDSNHSHAETPLFAGVILRREEKKTKLLSALLPLLFWKRGSGQIE